jgi:hypothetical protein
MMKAIGRTYSDLVRHGMTLAILAATLGTGCSGTTSNSTRTAQSGEKVTVAADSLDPALEALDPIFTIVEAGGKYSLSMQASAAGTTNSPRMSALRSIQSVTFQIRSSNGDLVDELTTEEVTTSGVRNTNGESSLTGSAGVTWEGNPGPGGHGTMIVRSAKGIAVRRAEFPASIKSSVPPSRSVSMSLEVNDRGPGLEFVVRAKRIAPGVPDEYLPSSEQFRIDIQNDRGETIWSSNHGMGYATAIGKVEPDVVGEESVFSIYWDGRSSLTHTTLSPGRYRVVAQIPAKPQPYMLIEELNWSGN